MEKTKVNEGIAVGLSALTLFGAAIGLGTSYTLMKNNPAAIDPLSGAYEEKLYQVTEFKDGEPVNSTEEYYIKPPKESLQYMQGENGGIEQIIQGTTYKLDKSVPPRITVNQQKADENRLVLGFAGITGGICSYTAGATYLSYKGLRRGFFDTILDADEYDF